MRSIDLRKQWKPLYTASTRKPSLVQVPRLQYLMIDGQGHPSGNPQFQQALEGLFAVTYTMKFSSKRGPTGLDWTVMPPEGLWWTEGNIPLDQAPKSAWRWTLMMMQPDVVDAAMLRTAVQTVLDRKNLARVADLRLESFREGLAVQILHVGPYDAEQPAIAKLQAFAAEEGLVVTGRHHEIYLSDPRRTKPEKLKTILRFAVNR